MTAWQGFCEGLAAPWTGFRFLLRFPGLWRYAIFPIVVNLAITSVLLVGFFAASIYGCTAVHAQRAEGYAGWAIEILLCALLLAAAVGATVVAWLVLQSVLCGFFYEKLALRVEIRLGTKEEDLRNIALTGQVVDTLRNVSGLAMIGLGCVTLQLIPVVGVLVGVPLGWYFAARTLGLEYLDYPLALRGLRRPEKLAFSKRHHSCTLGLGMSAAAITLIPVVNAVFPATAVVGAVLLHRRLTTPESASCESY